MQQIIDGLTHGMGPRAREQFTKLFPRVFSAPKPLPPIIEYTDIKHSIPYDDRADVFRTSVHIGQRKLFLTELQFITNAIPPDANETIVYAGAAPSNKTGFLANLFPNVKFILVDPNTFNIFDAEPIYLRRRSDPEPDLETARELIKQAAEGSSQLYIINSYMSGAIATAIKEIIPRNYFISDVRTKASESLKQPDELDILWNLAMQYNWMCEMKPVLSILKFRHPFYTNPDVFMEEVAKSPLKEDFALARENGIDFIENFKTRRLVYWEGRINIQAWAGHSSTESRLVTDSSKIHDYGTPTEYENKYFYYNSIPRCYGRHENPNASRKLGFDLCNDCAIENYLWENYIKEYPAAAAQFGLDVQGFVEKLSKLTFRPLLRENHGRMFARYNFRELLRAISEYRRNPKTKKRLIGGAQ